MSIFEKNKPFTRLQFRQRLRKADPTIPKTGGKRYSFREREKMEKELFPYSRFKSHISENEVKLRLKELRGERYRARTRKEKLEIDRKLRFLKEFTGVKPLR